MDLFIKQKVEIFSASPLEFGMEIWEIFVLLFYDNASFCNMLACLCFHRCHGNEFFPHSQRVLSPENKAISSTLVFK